jgi:hypothetical protein
MPAPPHKKSPVPHHEGQSCYILLLSVHNYSRKPQAASRKPQAASRKPQAASRKPQAASHYMQIL